MIAAWNRRGIGAVLLLLSLVVTSCAPDTAANETVAVGGGSAGTAVYHNTISASDPSFTTSAFLCPTGKGSALRCWFDNSGSTACTVTLYKQTVLGLAATHTTVTVAAGSREQVVCDRVEGKSFVIKVQAADGAPIQGTLGADQLNP